MERKIQKTGTYKNVGDVGALVSNYRQKGFVHVPQVLSKEELAVFVAEAQQLFEQEKKVSWDENGSNVMDWVADVEVKSTVMRKLVLHPEISYIAEKLAGSGLRLLKSELLLKRDKGSAITPMHIDDFAFPVGHDGHTANTLTCWVALVDVPVEKGCMTFIEGSHHHLENYLENEVQNQGSGEGPTEENGEGWSEWMMDPLKMNPALNWLPRVTVPLRAGDCTFHHSWTVHMAGDNQSGKPRLSLATVYTDENARFNAEKASFGEEGESYDEYQPASFKGLQDGQLLPDKLFPRLSGGAVKF